MNVVVSKKLADDYHEFVVVDSLKKASELVGVTKLIIHNFIETEFDAGIFISQFRQKGVKTFIYINSSPSAIIRTAIKGVDGYYYSDEFYLDDEEELSALLDDIEANELDKEADEYSLATPALATITNFMQGFIRGDKLVQTPIFLESVESAINDLTSITHQQELQIHTMGASAIEVFEKASAILKNMDMQRKLIEKQLEEFEQNQANVMPAKPSFGNNIMFFSPYKYMGNSKVLLIREYAPCRYLTSFVLGYLNHLHYELNRRPKLIFICQKGMGVALKYENYCCITQESMSLTSLYDSEIIFTNNPKKEVMKDLLTKPNDIIIVVDRLYGSQDIVTGRVTRINAVGSRSDISRYKVKPEETIFSVTAQPKQLFTIPTIKQFPIEEDSRQAIYSQVMGNAYKILDKKIGL